MQRFAYLILAAAIVQPALAATSVTVQELEKKLAHIKGMSDGAAADELSSLELTERASSARLQQWETELRGDRSRNALIALVDASAFLKLPAADLLPAPQPDQETATQIMNRAAARLESVFSMLPNFYANRNTTHFEDSLQAMQTGPLQTASTGRRGQSTLDNFSSLSTYEPIHPTARVDVIVSYRDGNEVIEPPKGKKAPEQVAGLTTIGEFGPVLEVIMGDAQHGKVAWDHWEEGPTGTLAVFRFAVAEPQSHFFVKLGNGASIDTLHPAYHGEISIDPESGDIFRVTEVAEMAPPQDRVQAELVVEYAPVPLGDRNYICPVRGVAIMKVPTSADPGLQRANSQALQTYLNDEAFTEYHLFRADTRILPETDVQQN
jgi:hypothetical protein